MVRFYRYFERTYCRHLKVRENVLLPSSLKKGGGELDLPPKRQFFSTVSGIGTVLENVGKFLQDYTESQPEDCNLYSHRIEDLQSGRRLHPLKHSGNYTYHLLQKLNDAAYYQTACFCVPVVFVIRDKWVFAITAWRVLRLRIEERLPIWRVAANILNK